MTSHSNIWGQVFVIHHLRALPNGTQLVSQYGVAAKYVRPGHEGGASLDQDNHTE